MVQAAITVTEGRVPALVIGELVDAGMDMLTEPVRLLPDVPERARRPRRATTGWC